MGRGRGVSAAGHGTARLIDLTAERRSNQDDNSGGWDTPAAALPEGSLRPVTVLFADIKGFTRLSQVLPAEQLVDAINRCFDALGGPIVHYGGEIDKYIGDGVMARFGAPVAHQDDPRRAVLAAVEMHAALRRLNRTLRHQIGYELEMRIGINTGVVLAGPIGGVHHREYTVMGDAVNVASRLEHAAPVGSIVISETTRAHVGNAFRLRRRRSVRIRGREGTLRSYVVLGHAAAPRPRSASAVCTGRDAEVDQTLTALSAVREGRRAVVQVRGEMGIGKSQILRAVQAARPTRAYRWLDVSCPPYGQDLPYATLATLLRRLMAQLERRGAGSLEAILAADDVTGRLDTQLAAAVVRDLLVHSDSGVSELTRGLPAQFRRGLLARAAKTLLRAAASGGRGQVIALDDCQWLDEASAIVIGEAVGDLDDCSLGWVLAHRPEWAPPAEWPIQVRVSLSPLTREASATLARELLGADAAESVISFVGARAEGNPLYLVELCRALAETGELPASAQELEDPAHAEQDGPRHLNEQLRSLILSRVDALDQRARSVLDAAAVLGSAFPVGLLRSVLGAGEWMPVLSRLEQSGFLERRTQARGDGAGTLWTWQFRHPLVQETVYASKLAATRTALHRSAGLALEQMAEAEVPDRLPLLALHFGRSDDRERAVRYLCAAGDRARMLYLNREAVRYYDDALARLGSNGKERALRATVLAGKGGALEVLAEDAAALDCLHAALELEPVPVRSAGLWRQIAEIQRRRGASGLAQEALRAAEAALADVPAGLELARVRIAGAMLAWDRQANVEARTEAEGALTMLAEHPGTAEYAAAARAIGVAAASAGDLTAARSAFEQALAAARAANDAYASATVATNLGSVLRLQGNQVDARALYGQGLEFYERIGAKRGIAMTCNNLADLHWEAGDWENARSLWERALRLNEQIGDRRGVAIVLGNLGGALARRGELAVAEPLLRRAEALATELRAWETLSNIQEHLRLVLGPQDTNGPPEHRSATAA